MAELDIEERLKRAEFFMLKVSEYVIFGVPDSHTLDYFYDTMSELYAEIGEDEK